VYDLAHKLGKDVDQKGLTAFFTALDKDCSGTIDIQEFYTFWIWSMVKEGGKKLAL
jgi:Ca2+-binding EF-hand superfamily protein